MWTISRQSLRMTFLRSSSIENISIRHWIVYRLKRKTTSDIRRFWTKKKLSRTVLSAFLWTVSISIIFHTKRYRLDHQVVSSGELYQTIYICYYCSNRKDIPFRLSTHFCFGWIGSRHLTSTVFPLILRPLFLFLIFSTKESTWIRINTSHLCSIVFLYTFLQMKVHWIRMQWCHVCY